MAAEPTLDSIWEAQSGSAIDDALLDWPPDVFALTDTLLDRSEAYRFAVSPPAGRAWPPARVPSWQEAVADAATHWSGWRERPMPRKVSSVVRSSASGVRGAGS